MTTTTRRAGMVVLTAVVIGVWVWYRRQVADARYRSGETYREVIDVDGRADTEGPSPL